MARADRLVNAADDELNDPLEDGDEDEDSDDDLDEDDVDDEAREFYQGADMSASDRTPRARFERVTVGAYGDTTNGVIHLDARELHLARVRTADTLRNRRRTALSALTDLRESGIPGLIIAHVNGIRGGGA